MADPDKKTKHISDKFTSWKWQVLDGIAADQRLEHADFKFAYRVMQGVNEDTSEAFITDETICDDVSKFDRYACNRSRKRLVAAEWLEIVEVGRSSKATVYRFLDHQVNVFLEQRDHAREQRQANRTKRPKTDRRKKPPGSDNVRQEQHRNDDNVVADARSNVAVVPPLHIQTTHSPISLPNEESQDRATTREGWPRVGSREAARHILQKYVGARAVGDPERGPEVVEWLMGFEQWVKRLADRGLTDDDLKELDSDLEEPRALLRTWVTQPSGDICQ